MEQDPSAAVRDLCEKVFPAQQMFIADEHFYEKMIISLALDGTASEEGIQRILENNFQKHVSIGKISNILNQAARRAAEFDESVDLSGIRQGANDEIFQCGKPVLTGVDADTGYVYLLQPAARSADRRLRHILKKKYADAYLEIESILKGVKRASSLVENLNGRLR